MCFLQVVGKGEAPVWFLFYRGPYWTIVAPGHYRLFWSTKNYRNAWHDMFSLQFIHLQFWLRWSMGMIGWGGGCLQTTQDLSRLNILGDPAPGPG